MTWLTWRQLRTQTMITAVAIIAFGLLLLVTAFTITQLYADVAACTSDCTAVTSTFLAKFKHSAGFTVYVAALAVLYALPPMIGIFWGAPLIARELEAGTHRLVWNQSVTRTRWLIVKLAMGCALAAAAAGLLSGATTLWAQRLDGASHDRILPLVYGARGIVPVAYAIFAFLLGVSVGALIRRTVAAMAATLAVYAAAVAAMPLWVRAHLAPAKHDSVLLTSENLRGLLISGPSGAMEVYGADAENAWTVSNRSLTPAGAVFTGPADPTICGRDAPPATCEEWIGSLHLRQDLVYHPGSHFWSLQWAEAGLFLGLAALLAAFCFWWIRRVV